MSSVLPESQNATLILFSEPNALLRHTLGSHHAITFFFSHPYKYLDVSTCLLWSMHFVSKKSVPSQSPFFFLMNSENLSPFLFVKNIITYYSEKRKLHLLFKFECFALKVCQFVKVKIRHLPCSSPVKKKKNASL